MNYERKIPVDVALEIAGLDSQRFRDAVAKGFYPCAPETVRGARRMFGEPDLVALAAFATLTDGGVGYQVAGLIACQLRHRAGYDETRKGLTSVHFILCKDGERWVGPWYGPKDKRAQLDPEAIDAEVSYGVYVAPLLEKVNKGLKKAKQAPIEF